MVLDRPFLVQQTETQVQVILQVACVLSLMDELGADLFLGALALKSLKVVRAVLNCLGLLLLLFQGRCLRCCLFRELAITGLLC